jgi:spore coat protein U-like protein
MKPSKKLIAAAFAMLAMTGAQAADTHTINVNAEVVGTCRFNSASSDINLSLDPTAATNVSGSSTIQYRCTRGTTPIFVMASGSTGSNAAGNLVQGAESIAYTYASVNGGDGTGMGAAQAKDLTVTVTVNQANAANVAAGTYTDTIAITLTP